MPGSYGFSIDVTGNSLSQLKAIEAELAKMGLMAKGAADQVKGEFEGIGESIKDLGRNIVEVFALREVYRFGQELLNTTAEFEGFSNVIKYSSTGMVDASDNLNYIHDAVDRLHLPIREATEQFSEMEAGFLGTGIEGEKLRKIFEAVSTASSVLHLNPEQFSRTTFALKEIGELGTLQARQLRMLSFALPGSGQIAARAMGMSMEQLHEAMKKGEIKADDFLPKFGNQLQMQFEPGLANAGHSLISQMNDAKNAVTKDMLDIGESLRPLFVDILSTITNGLDMIRAAWNGITGNSSFVNSLRALFDIVSHLVPIWITYKAVMMGAAAVTSVFSLENGILTASMGSLTVMTDGATVAIEGFDSALIATGIGAFVVSLGLVVENLISMNAELDKTIDKKFKLSESNNQINTITGQYSSIAERMSTLSKLQPADKQKLANDIQEYIDKTRSQIPILNQRSSKLSQSINGAQIPSSAAFASGSGLGGLGGLGLGLTSAFENSQEQKKTRDALVDLNKGLGKINLGQAKDFLDVLKKMGFDARPNTNGSPIHNATNDDAWATSKLSGAQGGLGQAKVITININGPVQQNNNVHDSAETRGEAVEYLIRAINNLSQSQNSM